MKTEKHTRKEIIDIKLHAAGWNVADRSQVIEEFDIAVGLPEGVSEPLTPYQGHQFSDYVLLGKDAKPLAVVEAKKTSKDAAIGREQAKQYLSPPTPANASPWIEANFLKKAFLEGCDQVELFAP